MQRLHGPHQFGRTKRRTVASVSLCGVAFLSGCHRPAPGSVGGGTGSFTQDLSDASQAGLPVSAQALQSLFPPPEQNAAPLYTQLAQLIKSQPLSQEDEIVDRLTSRTLPSAQQFERVRRALKHRPELLPLIHQAAKRPECVFLRDWSRPAFVPMNELGAMRYAVRLLTAESRLAARDGKTLDAVHNEALGFRIARHTFADHNLLPYLASIAVNSITLSGLQTLLSMSDGDPAVAAAVRAAVEHELYVPSLSRALQYEAGSDIVMLEYLRKQGPTSFSEVSGDPASSTLPWKPGEWSTFVDINGSLLLKRFRRLIAVADLPYTQALPVFQAVDAESDRDKDRMHLLTLLFFMESKSSLDHRAQLQAVGVITRAAAATLAWRAKHGSFPSHLETALSPVPADPFDGKPIRYQLEGKGFVIYSVGTTGKFTGGTADKPPGRESLFRYPLPSYLKGPIKEY